MKDLKIIMQYMWKYLKTHKGIVCLFIIVVVLSELLEMANSLVLGVAIDNMLQAGTLDAIMWFAVLFLCLNLFSFIICYFAQVGGTKVMEISRIEVKRQISKHIEKTSLNYCGEVGTMSFMQRLNHDSALLAIFTINASGKILSKLFCFLFAFIVIYKINIICGIAALVELPVIVVLYKVFQKKMLEKDRICAEKHEIGSKRLYELMADIRHIKKNEIFPLLEKRYEEAAEQEVDAVISATKLDYVYSIINDNMDMFLKVFLFFYGGISVLNGNMTVGEFTIVYSYFSLVTSSCTYFLNLGKNIQDNKAYYERLKSITDIVEETNGTIQLSNIREIELSHVKFGYNEKDAVLQDFSYHFKTGNLYVIAGGNGCGKSTMISLLLGMYIDDHQGKITYNGYSIKELDMRTLRREQIGICEQEPYLIEDSIRYNMIYSNDVAYDKTLMKLAYHVSFDEFLNDSEYGLDTFVGEGGNALSGGQKQKTALVKVFYKNPDVLVLDEPTSAMDVEGQVRLINYLKEIKKDKIVIVITHDEGLIEAADEVVRM